MDTPRLLSRSEVAGRLGVTPETVSKYVEEGRLPKPCLRLGNTASTDRWHEKIIIDFIAPPSEQSINEVVEVDPLFFSIKDLCDEVRILQKDGFRILVAEKLLQHSPSDSFNHYRPTNEAFETNYFWRIEKYSKKLGATYYQTVVTPRGKEPILKILRMKTLYNILETKAE